MILTCPACDTKYVVKDSAIPPEGRKVRCASCKHSWHQDPDPSAMAAEPDEAAPFVSFGGPPEPAPEDVEPLASEPTSEAVADQFVAEVPEPAMDEVAGAPAADDHGVGGHADEHDTIGREDERVVEADWAPIAAPAATSVPAFDPVVTEDAASEWQPVEDDVGYQPVHEEEAPRSRKWLWILGLLVLLAAAAVAFWVYAPSQWKEKAGIAAAGDTPLQLMITSKDRQELASGNQLLAVSGRVINPTDVEQDVPPIKAELRNKDTKQVVHRWTIAPPARVLAPRSSASFNSAEVDIPSGGDELVITLGG